MSIFKDNNFLVIISKTQHYMIRVNQHHGQTDGQTDRQTT